MGERHAAKAAAGLWCTAVAVALIGCAPDPAPTPLPTATGFASEAEAFAAAEATYRAYVDAVNASLAGQDGPKPTDFLSGAALNGELETARELEDLGLTIVGKFEVARFEVRRASATQVDGHVCLSIARTRALNSEGEDVTMKNREALLSLDVTFDWSPSGAVVTASKSSELSC